MTLQKQHRTHGTLKILKRIVTQNKRCFLVNLSGPKSKQMQSTIWFYIFIKVKFAYKCMKPRNQEFFRKSICKINFDKIVNILYI